MGDTKSFLPLGGAAQADNEGHRLDYLRRDQHDPVIGTRQSASEMLAAGVVAGAGGLVLEGILAAVKGVACWGVSSYAPTFGCTAASGLFWTYTAAIPVLAIGYLGVAIWSRIQRTRAETLRARVTRDRFSNPIDSLAVVRKTAEMNLHELLLATQAEIQMAPYKVLPAGLDALNVSSSNTNNAAKADAAALPDNAQPLAIVPVGAWLSWLTDEMVPHLLLIGKTRSGKSTLADIVLNFRAERGDKICILDPHWSTQDKRGDKKWGGLQPMAKNVNEIVVVLKQLKVEFEDRKRRMQLPAGDPDFTPEMCFEPITILIDEVPELVTELSANPALKSLWGETVKIFGSGGAKVNMNVMLLSQSPNIEDVGMNAKMRENFCTIAMANLAKPFVDNYERDRKRREELTGLITKHSRSDMKPAQLPAAAEYGGVVHVLSRDGILDHRVTTIDADVWDGVAIPRAIAPAATDSLLQGLLAQDAMRYGTMETAKTPENGFSAHSIAHSIVHSEVSDDDTARELALELFAMGMTQREVGERVRGRGLKIDQNELPTLQRKALGK